jgi:TetR/AcrR family transcriptional regulator, transcriptional repressor for nem operon
MNAPTTRNTKTVILDAAETLILTRGYNGFSYMDIANVVGIRTASIHHHFPTKEALGAAFVKRYLHRFERWSEQVALLPVAQKLASLLEMFKQISDNAEKICPMGMLTAEYPTLPLSIQDNLRALLSEIDLWLVQVLTQGQAEGYLRPLPEAPMMAKVIFNAMSASMKMARVFHDVDQLEQVFNAMTTMIRLPDKPTTAAENIR